MTLDRRSVEAWSKPPSSAAVLVVDDLNFAGEKPFRGLRAQVLAFLTRPCSPDPLATGRRETGSSIIAISAGRGQINSALCVYSGSMLLSLAQRAPWRRWA